MGSLASQIDYQEHGGAYLLGVNGNVIIAHGRSQSKTIKNAIGIAMNMGRQEIAEAIKEAMNGQTNRG